MLGDMQSIRILNQVVTMKCKVLHFPGRVDALWETFVSHKRQNMEIRPEDVPDSPLGEAYYKLKDALH